MARSANEGIAIWDGQLYDFRDRNSAAHFQVCSFTLTEFIYAFLPCIVSIAVKAEVESEFRHPRRRSTTISLVRYVVQLLLLFCNFVRR